MAFATIYLQNPRTGKTRVAPVGISWTTFFFGFIPALFRSDWFGAVVQLAIGFVTCGLSALVFMFIYNKWYLKRLLNDGFDIKSSSADITFIESRIGLPLRQMQFDQGRTMDLRAA